MTATALKQEEDHGCGVACLGMLLRFTGSGAWTYRMMRDYFPEMRSQGLSEVEIVHFLNAWGFWHRRWWITTAPAPMIGKLVLALVDDGHWIVVRGDSGVLDQQPEWSVFDPARPEPKPIAEYRIQKWIELKREVGRNESADGSAGLATPHLDSLESVGTDSMRPRPDSFPVSVSPSSLDGGAQG